MQTEEEVLGFWAKRKIFEKSISKRGPKAKRFVFFEGPPYANGLPGIHHVEARVFKDVVARYKTMRGFRVERRAGWDTHGLPTEMAVEKKLGIKRKKDIEEKIGIRAFVEAARADVFSYKKEFERMTERIGYWLDLKNAYVTMNNSYIESLWWIVKEFWSKGLLYEDKKTVPWCTRCGTALSSHELAQGYKRVSDVSVYVRFRLKTRRASLLAWTTTPWTLPGNMAVAVNPDFEYVTIDDKGDKLILLAERARVLFPELTPMWKEKGSSLLGLEYEGPYSVGRVLEGDFVSQEEGTGVVHIAPAFGEDDLRVGKRANLTPSMIIDDEGRFTEAVSQWQGIYVKEADPLIVKDLEQKGHLFKSEPYEHDYPHCWRCDSPLLYVARQSWWVGVSTKRKELVEANKKIVWHPEHIRDGRFGQWIKEAKDWAFSRERYWGTPLPVWRCAGCSHVEVVGSIDEAAKLGFTSGNTYYLMRHGFAKNNLLGVASSLPNGDNWGLTPRGRGEVKLAATQLKKAKISLIVASDLVRTKETAQILARELKVPVLFDEDLRDMHVGDFERKEVAAARAALLGKDHFSEPFPGVGGESWDDLKRRMVRVFAKLEGLHKNKNILVVGHGDPHWFLEGIMRGTLARAEVPIERYLKNADFHKMSPKKVAQNELGEVDLHRPFIDELVLKCPECKGEMRRVPDVIDVWFDSGAMPYAAWHYPFENRERIDKKISYPADFIAEGIDQTRGWFYTLLAVSVLLGKGAPYKNVMSLGFVLDKVGKKMSKSKGNVVEPMKLVEQYGADAVRWYFFTINQPEDDKLYNVADLEQAKRNFLDLLLNTLNFYKLYKKPKHAATSSHVLDRWVLARLAQVHSEVTKKMDAYDVVGAARLLEDFVANDISRWYVRRSRERMRNGEGVGVLRGVLLDVARLSAPFVPFVTEIIYHELGGKGESIHLEDWLSKKAYSKKILTDMKEVRELAGRGLELRARAGIKIRQPLGALVVKKTNLKGKEFLDILKDELNVKDIVVNKKLSEDIMLDTHITPELKAEGDIREIVRLAQDMRKKTGLTTGEPARLFVSGLLPQALREALRKSATIADINTSESVGSATARVGEIFIIRVEKM